MKTSDFYFELPAENIAQFPSITRGESRLMTLDRRNGAAAHHHVGDIARLIPKDALVVFNNTRVRKARILGANEQGARVEFLLLDIHGGVNRALVKNGRRLREGTRFSFSDGVSAQIAGHDDGAVLLAFDSPIDDTWLERAGHIPLPPYIKRADEADDAGRYQTVYAKETGSIAAPTAGLHFTAAMLDELRRRGVRTAFITLHVGLGTFLPVRSAIIEEHTMHTEHYYIDDDAAAEFEAAKREGRPILAVGTTTLRTLESAWDGNRLRRGAGQTALFIYGDYRFSTADMLWTNFHTPESTLLMLVSSFCGAYSGAEEGRVMLLDAYQKALAADYRFFSYGDAMLIT